MARKRGSRSEWPEGFFALPKRLMELQDFRELSWSANKVLTALFSQYNGKNNGDLSATHSIMQDWGGMAEGTLAKALRELQDRNLIVKTRQNRRGREGARCALYALTWLEINDCKGKDLDMVPSITPLRRLSQG